MTILKTLLCVSLLTTLAPSLSGNNHAPGPAQSLAPATTTFSSPSRHEPLAQQTASTILAPPATPAVGADPNRGTANTTSAVTLGIIDDSSAGPIAGNTIVWVDDHLPPGAVAGTDGDDNWAWIASDPAPYSGMAAIQSSSAAGPHQQYFYGATPTLPVLTGDLLFACIYLDPVNPPTEVMLQWNNGTWEHRAYWGDHDISYGADGTVSSYRMGPLPPTGQWVQLVVPASAVGLENSSLNGMAFTLYGGRATWDYAGKASPLSAGANPGSTTAGSTLNAIPVSTSLQLVWNPVGSVGSSGSQLHLHLQGQPYAPYLVQFSSDLNQWLPLATYLAGGDGTVDFTDPQPARVSGFYRPLRLPSSATAGNGPLASAPGPSARILLKPKPGADLGPLGLALGTDVLQVFPAIGGLEIVQVPAGQTAQQVIAAYQQSGSVEYAEPDHTVHLLLTPNDPQYANGALWALHNTGQLGGTPGADINAPAGWDLQSTANNIIVAVLDTGGRYTHEDLAGNLWTQPGGTNHGINTINGSDNPWDDFGHGTHVSGTIGATGNNSLGVVGVAWSVQLMECKFIDSQGNGSISDAITCINFARTHGAKIINASWGATNFTSSALHDAIASARDAGIIFVAACGNSQDDNDGPNAIFPASYTDLDNVISVAATTRNDQLASFSNFGAKSVHLGAPGESILSTYNDNDSSYVSFSGTSMSAAFVSGACAVVWAHFPAENYKQIIQRVLAGTDPLPSLSGKTITGGRLDLFKALSGSPPPPPPAQPPVANFSANPTSGNEPLNVQFTDQSTGTVSSRDWDFGDGSAHSSAQNPSHTYTSAGTFTVTLTVLGAGTTSTKTGTIQVNNPPPPPPASPVANFSANPTSGNAPLNVQFTDQSTGTIVAWDWDFGDGLPHSSAQNPSHLYLLPQDYTATLTVTGADGSTSSKGVTIHVTVGLPLPAPLPPPLPGPLPLPGL